ncbi:hypothetical protein [Sulfobacillus thermosulfidooxidans]|uniref:hypothetical protein n=1 Tax=Sulfobacillus thermosulfidooxidans TaxID=28034 RepID=UPI0003109557|nr:hypothetical protein [Sulfobacillus thermosulfidooxidans]
MHVEITLIQPENYLHSLAFAEVLESLVYGFNTLGHYVQVTRNHVSTTVPTIILGANLLSPEVIHNLPATAILYNLEQVTDNSPWITSKWTDALHGKVIWDYSSRNIEYWTSKGLVAHYVPIGYAPVLTRINRKHDKDIDVVFYGSLNERRIKVIEELKKHNLNVVALAGVYGKSRDDIIARSKLALNVHFYTPNIFEVVRASYLIANRVPVLSERNSDTFVPIEWDTLVYWSSYDMLIKRCINILSHEDLENITNYRFSLFQDYSIERILYEALKVTFS